MTRSEMNTVKQFLSKCDDVYRAAYGKWTNKHVRQCIVVGTTNETEFLKDYTGGRRFWPVDLGRAGCKKNIWRDLPGEVPQIWAEAVLRYCLGEPLILRDYTDACELIRETEQDIRRLNYKKKTILQTNVKDSNPEFPYQEQHFRIQGTAFTTRDDSGLRCREALLERRKANALRIRTQVEEWMLTIPARMQRIVRYRYLEGLSWEQVAVRMGRGATADGVRKELARVLG